MFRDESGHIRTAVVEKGEPVILEFYTANRIMSVSRKKRHKVQLHRRWNVQEQKQIK
jgi:hypothetical protein